MFLQVCVCPQGGRVSASVHAGMPDPPGSRPPRTRQTPRDQADTTQTRQTPRWTRHPLDQADTPREHADNPPWDQADTPLGPGSPPAEADSSIRSTSGRYASYRNAFLFGQIFAENFMNVKEMAPIGGREGHP